MKFGRAIFILILVGLIYSISGCDQNEPPGSAFKLPKRKIAFIEGEIIPVEILVVAWDRDGTVSQIEFLIDGISKSSVHSDTLQSGIDISDFEGGDHTIGVVVSDDKGAESPNEFNFKIHPLEEFTDARDGNTYRYVTIGEQTWMAENLAYFPEVFELADGSAELPRYYVYGYDSNDLPAAKQHAHYTLFGVLYNWEAAKVCCPEGWHLPASDEWDELDEFILSDLHEEWPVAKYLAYTTGWDDRGLNTYGFSAQENGFRESQGSWWMSSMFYNVNYWSASVYNDTRAYLYLFSCNKKEVEYNQFNSGLVSGSCDEGYSVRCVKDK